MAHLSVFVFQCEDTDLHALTLYRSGDNLPPHQCHGSWVYRGQLLMTEQSLATLPIDVAAALAQLRANGLFYGHLSSRIILFPR